MYEYIWLVPLLPLAGAVINGLLGRRFRFSERLIGGIAVGTVALSFVLSIAAVWSYGFGSAAKWPAPFISSQLKYTWISGGDLELTQGGEERARVAAKDGASSETGTPEHRANDEGAAASARQGGSLDIEWSYYLDPLSGIFMLIVTGVGLCIFIFATGYMHGDPGYYRFFCYLGLFMFSMLVLVMGSNFLMMFVGWEGVGLCSYLLIGYYFDRKEAADASRKAFITNRIGDFGFTLAIFGIIATFGSAGFSEVFSKAASYPLEALGQWGLMSWIALGLFIGAIGKSAQIPLYVWLPDAMAGPTPVSALIHAATMVTAGLYMITRTNVIFQHSQTMMLVVAIVGAVTALFAATIGITQNDIKKVLAYSTVSQLGFMFLACGVGAFVIGIFHVLTHAFFKALMFLGAGSVIHGMHHEQDMRRMGGLKKYMPITYMTFLAGWLAICGIIPFSGFWSKDEILWKTASTSFIPGGWILWIVATIAATCTAFYMTRLMAMTFWGKERFRDQVAGGEADEAHAHAVDEGVAPHDAVTESAGDRPRHEPGEHVGPIDKDHSSGHHGHGFHEPHESPPSMWIPLAALAVLATIGGLIGISPAFTGGSHVGGKMNIVTWLEPVIWKPGGAEEHAAKPPPGTYLVSSEPGTLAGEVHEAPEAETEVAPYGDTGFNLAHAVEKSLGHAGAEWFFIILSLVVAGLGMGLAWLFYIKKPHLPDAWAAKLRPLYRASFNKYWVDELYAKLFTRRTMDAARGVYAFDSRVIDGAVNGTAWFTRLSSKITGFFDKWIVDGLVNGVANFIGKLMSRLIRSAQTGLTANYALFMVLGLILALVYILFQ